MAGTGIGTFNDRLRDAVRGGGPFDGDPRVQGFATGLYTDPNGDPANGTAPSSRARLLHYQDLIKVGLTGNLAAYRFTDRTGHAGHRRAGRLQRLARRVHGAPGEAVTYVDAHDNEILYDALAYKLPAGTTAGRPGPDAGPGAGHGRARAGPGALAGRLRPAALEVPGPQLVRLRRLVQPDPLGLPGRQRLRPRACRRPPTTQAKWPYAQPLLADPALVPGCAAIDLAVGPLPGAAADPGRLAGVRPGHRRRRSSSG